MKNEFIQTVSHELRTPIAAIKGAMGILNSGVLGDVVPDVQGILSIPEKACVKLEDLVDDMLFVTTFEDTDEVVNYEMVEIMDLFKKSINDFKEILSEKNIEIITKTPSNLKIYTEIALISKAIIHLISNAIKFSSNNAKITISAEDNNENIKIHISDTGIGIKDKDKEKAIEGSVR